jgi:hypothetical protein
LSVDRSLLACTSLDETSAHETELASRDELEGELPQALRLSVTPKRRIGIALSDFFTTRVRAM